MHGVKSRKECHALRCLLPWRVRLLAAVAAVLVAAAALGHSRASTRVCVLTGDPLLTPVSRGTAEGFTRIAYLLAAKGFLVHVVLLFRVHSQSQCTVSQQSITQHLRGVMSSCAVMHGDGPLAAASASHAHIENLFCDVILSHEWWAPSLEVGHDRLLFPERQDGRPHPVLVNNFMGGLLWSVSWDVEHRFTVADWIQEYKEREGAFIADFTVFSNTYHMNYHVDRGWAIPGKKMVGPNILPFEFGRSSQSLATEPITGFAYVSVVDKRKGIAELLAAVLALPAQPIRLEIIGFLGKVGAEKARSFIQRTLKDAKHVNYTIHGPMEPTRVWAYVKEERLLLVCPSLLENAPTTLHLAASYHIPTLYYDTGGVREMVTAASAELTVLPPSVPELTKRLLKCLESGLGTVPQLQDSMFQAKSTWLDIFRLAAAKKKPRLRRAVNPPPFSVLVLDYESTTTTSLAFELRDNAASTDLVLLRHHSFQLVSGRLFDSMLFALAENPNLAGFVGTVETTRGILKPAGPFFFLSQSWDLCGPEAPLLVRTQLLSRFLSGFPNLPFRQWQFTSWLLFVEGEMVLQPAYVMSSFDGCLDTRECFNSGAVHFQNLRQLMQGEAEHIGELHLPHVSHPVMKLNLESLLNLRCLRSSSGSSYYISVAQMPRFCDGTVEHDNFTLGALQSSIAHQALSYCGSHCVFNALVDAASSTRRHGWHLDVMRECWHEITNDHTCGAVYTQIHRSLPWGLLCPFDESTDPPLLDSR